MSDELTLDALRQTARASLDELWPKVEAAGVTFPPYARSRLLTYLDHVLDTGRHLNLVSRKQLPHLVANHVAPSFTSLLAESSFATMREPMAYLDVGSGGGFPGAVIAAVRPEWRVFLVESMGKKADFLKQATASFDRVTVVRGRVEDLFVGPDGPPALITSRAVGPPAVIWPLVSRLVAPGGEVHVFVRRDDHARRAKEAMDVARGEAELLPPLEPAWCDGAVVRLRRRAAKV